MDLHEIDAQITTKQKRIQDLKDARFKLQNPYAYCEELMDLEEEVKRIEDIKFRLLK